MPHRFVEYLWYHRVLYVCNPYKTLISGLIHIFIVTFSLLKMIGIKILKGEFTFYFLLQIGEGE